MKTALALILFAVSAWSQDQSAIGAAQAACGPKNVKFSAKQDATKHPTPEPDAHKALVYVVQELGEFKCGGCALTRLGLDGTWVGANQGTSYFFFWTESGEHHLCLNWQSRLEGLCSSRCARPTSPRKPERSITSGPGSLPGTSTISSTWTRSTATTASTLSPPPHSASHILKSERHAATPSV